MRPIRLFLTVVGMSTAAAASATVATAEADEPPVIGRLDTSTHAAVAEWTDCPFGQPLVEGTTCTVTFASASQSLDRPNKTDVSVRRADWEVRSITETRQVVVDFECDADGNCTPVWETETVTELRWVEVHWIAALGQTGRLSSAPRISISESLSLVSLECTPDSGCSPRAPVEVSLQWTLAEPGPVSPIPLHDPFSHFWHPYFDPETGAVMGVYRPVHSGMIAFYETTATASIDGTPVTEPLSFSGLRRSTGRVMCLASHEHALEECLLNAF